MKRPATTLVGAAIAAGVVLIGLSALRRAARDDAGASRCGPGFHASGPRCAAPAGSCPTPLVAAPRGCDAPPRSVVTVPRTSVRIGPSDWEAEGRVAPRTVVAGPLELDRLEISVGAARCARCPAEVAARLEAESGEDPGRAASGLSLDEARAICAARGGRLPTEDEWIVAAAGDRPRRYPWGDTGAVCRRGAWGLVRGPCASGATGPDTVGAHPDGATPLGIHDLAGNVAEWVEGAAGPGLGVVRGGSYDTDLATELRTWARLELPAAGHDPRVGVRCAYDLAPPAPEGAVHSGPP